VSRPLSLDISLPLHRFALSIQWETEESALGIFGPSGAGKTSILEAIAGLRRGARGTIRLGDESWLDTPRGLFVPPERRGVGYVPQDSLLFPHLDVIGNLTFGRARAARHAERRIPPRRVLDILELNELAGRRVGTLSGGERQRVALGRALSSAPALLLLDEPLAGLDRPLRRRILTCLFRIQREFRIPTLFVSHDPAEVALLSREVTVLERGEVVGRGQPEQVLHDPAILPMARAEGFENILHGRVAALVDGAAAIEVGPRMRVMVADPSLTSGAEVVIAARAEDLILAVHAPAGLSAQNLLAGTIREIREPAQGDPSGGQVVVLVDLDSVPAPLVVAVTGQARRRLALRRDLAVHVVGKANSFRVLATG
jgi:molybdate transport system ATP-binding protein